MVSSSVIPRHAYIASTRGRRGVSRNHPVHIGLCSPAWPAHEYPNGIVTYVHHLRTELMNQGHRVSVFAPVIGRTNRDSGIYLVEETAKYRILIGLTRLAGRHRSYPFLHWGRSIAAKVNDVHQMDPIDVLETDESFGWCAEMQKHVPVPVVVKLHGPAFLTLIEEAGQTEIGLARIEM